MHIIYDIEFFIPNDFIWKMRYAAGQVSRHGIHITLSVYMQTTQNPEATWTF